MTCLEPECSSQCVSCPPRRIHLWSLFIHPRQDADDILNDPDGRWLAFKMKSTDFVILERKGIPAHLTKLENLETPVTLQSIVIDLEDMGEAPFKQITIRQQNT